MVDPDKIDYNTCPNCGGKIIYLGCDNTHTVHTLMCEDCKAMWDIEVKLGRLQDAWDDICERECNNAD